MIANPKKRPTGATTANTVKTETRDRTRRIAACLHVNIVTDISDCSLAPCWVPCFRAAEAGLSVLQPLFFDPRPPSLRLGHAASPFCVPLPTSGAMTAHANHPPAPPPVAPALAEGTRLLAPSPAYLQLTEHPGFYEDSIDSPIGETLGFEVLLQLRRSRTPVRCRKASVAVSSRISFAYDAVLHTTPSARIPGIHLSSGRTIHTHNWDTSRDPDLANASQKYTNETLQKSRRHIASYLAKRAKVVSDMVSHLVFHDADQSSKSGLAVNSILIQQVHANQSRALTLRWSPLTMSK